MCLGEKSIQKSEDGKDENMYQQIIDIILDKCNISKGEEMVCHGNNNFCFQLTNTENELEHLKGKSNNTNNFSVIDFRKCENILKSIYGINDNISLIIMKYEKITNISSETERALQYEIYEPYNKTKLNLSFCDKKIDVYIPVIK